MSKAFLETSVINRAVDEGVTPEALRAALLARGHEPALGLHVIYELARSFLDTATRSRGQQLFSFVELLAPAYIPETGELLRQEVLRLRTGAAVMPFMPSLNQVATRLEVSRLAQGVFDRRAEEFIRDRERQVATDVPEQNQQYLEQVREARQRNPGVFRGIRTFEDILSAFNYDFPRLAQTVLPLAVTASEARQMVRREAEFLALRAAMRANLYLTFIQIVHQAQPGADRIDDLRNVVDASYCAAFVSADSGLLRAAEKLNAQIELIPWTDLLAEIRSQTRNTV